MIKIGKIKSLHGVKGHVLFEHQLPVDFDLDQLDAIMIELMPESFIPFFVEEINDISDTEIILKLEEYNDRNQAIEILNKSVYAPPGIEVHIDNDFEWKILIGASLEDQHHTQIGIIEDILINGKQLLLDVKSDVKEYLIPFSDDLVIDFNDKQKLLTLELADGLLDL